MGCIGEGVVAGGIAGLVVLRLRAAPRFLAAPRFRVAFAGVRRRTALRRAGDFRRRAVAFLAFPALRLAARFFFRTTLSPPLIRCTNAPLFGGHFSSPRPGSFLRGAFPERKVAYFLSPKAA